MDTCTTCGNGYDKAFTVVTHDGREHIFDSIECAAERIAPRCAHCNCRILGHGVEADSSIYCCASCAREGGLTEMRDRA